MSCPAAMSRRRFLATTSSAALSLPLLGCVSRAFLPKFEPKGPASRCEPVVRACFVRRKGAYGMWWPGAVFDGEAARQHYVANLRSAAAELGVKLELAPKPLFTTAEADQWLAEAKAAKADGLVVVLLDRHGPAWASAAKAVATGIPTVIVAPVGTAFTTNTADFATKQGCFICATDDFAQVRYGLKMLKAWAKLRSTRCLVIKGNKPAEKRSPQLGITFRYIPGRDFIEEYRKTATDAEVEAIADYYIRHARHVRGPSRQDVVNGARSYVAVRKLLERERADAVTMDCLGLLARKKLSLPCLAWSKMNDEGVPAACEADLGAAVTHCIVQYLFDRPGFQQDPVPETLRGAIIGAHCTCPTRLRGFAEPPEPFDLIHHHALRDATARPYWEVGHRVTCADVSLPGPKRKARMLISAGRVLENVAVPPAGGCVVSVMVKFDGVDDVLAYPGFHQIFFYGDFKRELVQFCRLTGIEAVVV